jgi:hypothetical protein
MTGRGWRLGLGGADRVSPWKHDGRFFFPPSWSGLGSRVFHERMSNELPAGLCSIVLIAKRSKCV